MKRLHHQSASSSAAAASSDAASQQTVTGKRTYADASLSHPDSSKSSLPLSLQREGRRRRRRRTNPSSDTSVVGRLFARQLGQAAPHPSLQFATQRFANFSLVDSLDTHDLNALPTKIPWLRNRSRIVEIVSHHDLIFSLTHNGVCAAFSRDLKKRVCFLNVHDDEVIRSLFLNKTNNSLITVSVFKKDDFSSLHCRSTSLSHIREGYLQSGIQIFESESLRWPGFVEFDDVNSKILTFSAEDNIYKVWDLQSYNMLYSIKDERIQEIKISPGVMLLIYSRQESHVPIRINNIEDGKTLKEINHLLNRTRKLEFVEQFHEKVLVKQEHENLKIVDICTGDEIEVERSHQLSPNAFIFLYESELFLTFQQRNVHVWNFKGQRVTDFDDHVLFRPDCTTSAIYITRQQDIIVSYCQQLGNCRHGTINLSWINSGKLLGKISCGPNLNHDHIRALDDVTALYYNEERNEIYTGSREGVVHVWSN